MTHLPLCQYGACAKRILREQRRRERRAHLVNALRAALFFAREIGLALLVVLVLFTAYSCTTNADSDDTHMDPPPPAWWMTTDAGTEKGRFDSGSLVKVG